MAINVLVVDDSETVRQVIAKTLHLANLPLNQIFMAANGKEALEVLAENWIDLVFSDINMPVMTGIELIEEMHKDEVMKAIPVIVVSTEGSQTRMEELRAKGVSAYIRKPFTPETLRKTVEEVLGALDHENGI